MTPANEQKSSKKLSAREADALVREVRERLDDSWQNDRDNRQDAANDLRFLAGDQWPETVRREREMAGRPMITVNRLPQFLNQIVNDIRQADLAIKVVPEDDGGDPQLADVYDGLIRQIQYQSSAKHVFAQAAHHQVACGIGWFRIVTQYTSDTAFEQEIRLKAIQNPLSVYDDPGAVEPDRSDARWRAVAELIPRKAFKELYPKAADREMDVPSDGSESSLFWSTDDYVRIVEYWRKVPVKKTLALMPDGSTVDWSAVDDSIKPFLPPPVRTRVVDTHKVEQILVSGAEVLDGPHEWPGTMIPIIPVIGGEIPLETKTYRFGMVRFARDPQQLYNFYRTATAEAIALQPKAPYLVTPNMIGEFKAIWDNASKNQLPYLPYHPDPEAPGATPRREAPPALPAALMQEAQIASEDMKATTGIYDAALGARSNETAGVAIRARQIEADTANYHYIDNVARALEYAGRCLVELIPQIYDSERILRLRGEDGQEKPVTINQVVMGHNGIPIMINDLSAGRFDVRVNVGKSYTTKRAEAAESMLAFVQAVPGAGAVAADLIAKNFDWPGAEELAKRLRAMVPPEMLVDPDDPSTQPPPDPVAERMKQLAGIKAELEIMKDASDVMETTADAEAKRAETMLKALQLGMTPEQLAQYFPVPFPDVPQLPPAEQPAQGMPMGMDDPGMMPSGAPEIDPDALAALQGMSALSAPADGPQVM
jgi:hypothetical protein